MIAGHLDEVDDALEVGLAPIGSWTAPGAEAVDVMSTQR
jgi:hypothetical protein